MHVLISQLKIGQPFAFQSDWQESVANGYVGGYADHVVVAPLHYRGEVTRTSRSCKMTANFKVTTRAQCHLCLDDITYDFNEDFAVELLPIEDANTEDGYEIDADELDLIYYENGKIDFDAIVAESLILVLPTRHVCKEDCKGLCSMCGKNLNQQSCQCQQALRDIND